MESKYSFKVIQGGQTKLARVVRSGSGVTGQALVVEAEEGVRYQPDMMGSLVHAGGYPLQQALDTLGSDGRRLGDELQRIGYAGTMDCGKSTLARAILRLVSVTGGSVMLAGRAARGCGRPAAVHGDARRVRARLRPQPPLQPPR